MQEYLKNLNEEQIKPVLDTDGAVLVIAGAGSGKTRVLTSRIAYLVNDKNVYPSNILAITFTNKASKEMKERLSKLVDGSENMWICTIHKMCVLMLRFFGDKIGYNENFTIYSENEKDRVIKKLVAFSGIDDEKIIKNIKYNINHAKMLGESPDTYAENNSELKDLDIIIKIYREYEAELSNSNALDFDDLLIKTYELLSTNREALDYYSAKFKYIHVDEFQDTNSLQYNIIKLLTIKYNNLFVVGDDDQSIYSWRGAKIENILNFEKDFKGAKVYKLERNYRSTKNILSSANSIIQNNLLRKNKKLWTENDNGETVEFFEANDEYNEAYITASIIKNKLAKGYKASDFAVLMRINALSRTYEQKFLEYDIPYKVYGGFKFFDRKEIKDLVAYLRIIANPDDNDALLRVINVPKRGIGQKTIELLENVAIREGISYYEALIFNSSEIAGAGGRKLQEFKELLSEIVAMNEFLKLNDLIRQIINKINYRSIFESNIPENEDKKMNIEEFINSIDEYCSKNKNPNLAEYLNGITLSSDSDNISEDETVTIATIHAVKGLEYKVVFICGLDENIMPISRSLGSSEELEEERRLMYVAITRAREKLYLTRSKNRVVYGSNANGYKMERTPTMRSRFINDLREELNLEPKPSYKTVDYASKFDRNINTSNFDSKVSESSNYNKNDYNNYSDKKTVTVGGRTYNKDTFNDLELPESSFSGGASLKNSNFMQARQINNNQKDISKFVAGSKIVHKKFGEGTIIMVKGEGNAAICDVAFKNVGVKQLSIALAPIKLI